MPTHVAPRRDFHGLEVRRKQAARLFAAGRETQGAIARRLGVDLGAVQALNLIAGNFNQPGGVSLSPLLAKLAAEGKKFS